MNQSSGLPLPIAGAIAVFAIIFVIGAFYGVWVPIEALATVLSALAIIATATIALQTIRQNAYFERVKLTIGILDAPYTLRAVDAINDLYTGAGGNLDLARQGYSTQFAQHTPNAREYQNYLGTYAYIAGLYHRKILDADTLLAKDYVTVAVATYILDPALRNLVHIGAIPDSVFDLARDALAMVRKQPSLFLMYPQLEKYTV